MSDASLVLLPESFRGGCSIGAGFTGLSQIACANGAAYIAVARREQLAKLEPTHYVGEAQNLSFRSKFMKPVFLQLQCFPGKTYEVAAALFEREIVSELYSTSGDYDLLMKIYIPEDQDIGKFINDNVLDIQGIARSLTTMTFTAF